MFILHLFHTAPVGRTTASSVHMTFGLVCRGQWRADIVKSIALTINKLNINLHHNMFVEAVGMYDKRS